MAAVTCKYHTQTPARWRCDTCQINFCLNCVRNTDKHAPVCPVCKHELQSLGVTNSIKPFWTRLREFFLYPLHPAPLAVMLILTVIAYLLILMPGWYVPVNFLFWTIPLNLFFTFPFLFVFLKYAQSVLEDTAHGHLKPKPLSIDQLTSNGLIVVKLLLIVVVFNLVQFSALDLFNQVGSYIIGFILAFATPAAVMVLTMEDKLFSALNPATISEVIMRIGPPYIILFVLFYPLQLARDTVIGLLTGMVNPALGGAVFVFVSMYFYLIMFNMMGYLLYQKHEELGFSLDVLPDELQQVSGKSIEQDTIPELRAVEILLHEGKNEEAIKQLQEIIHNNPADTDARERLLKLLRLTGNMDLHRHEGQQYITYLLINDKPTLAAKVFQACYEYDKDFKPEKANERFELGKFLRQNGQARLAMAILNNLHKDFPSYDNIPPAYLLVAKMLCEQFNEDTRAKQVLEFVLQNYPSHPLKKTINDYLRIIDEVSNH